MGTVVYPAVLARHAVEHKNPASASGQCEPEKVRNEVGVEPHRSRPERGYDFEVWPGTAKDIWSAFWLLGRYQVELDARVLLNRLNNWSDDGIIHRPPGIDENSPPGCIPPPLQLLVGNPSEFKQIHPNSSCLVEV